MTGVLLITMLAVGDWSEPVDGLRGRLIVAQGKTLGDGKTRESLIYLELQNVAETGERVVSFDPYGFPYGLKCELFDGNGKAVPQAPSTGRNGAQPVKTL